MVKRKTKFQSFRVAHLGKENRYWFNVNLQFTEGVSGWRGRFSIDTTVTEKREYVCDFYKKISSQNAMITVQDVVHNSNIGKI